MQLLGADKEVLSYLFDDSPDSKASFDITSGFNEQLLEQNLSVLINLPRIYWNVDGARQDDENTEYTRVFMAHTILGWFHSCGIDLEFLKRLLQKNDIPHSFSWIEQHSKNTELANKVTKFPLPSFANSKLLMEMNANLRLFGNSKDDILYTYQVVILSTPYIDLSICYRS